jgi:hypothetical protein
MPKPTNVSRAYPSSVNYMEKLKFPLEKGTILEEYVSTA